MTPSPTPTRSGARARGTVAALCGIAATTAIAGAVAGVAIGPAAAAGHPVHRPGTPAATAPVVINCAGHAQTRPRSYTLACADGGAYISAMSWANWGSAAAFGSGTYDIKVCVPSCVAGHLATFPALAALWRAKSLPGHASVRYFTRMTLIFTGNRAYKAGSKTNHLPATLTFPLSAFGGA